jgi:hypothetical protein
MAISRRQFIRASSIFAVSAGIALGTTNFAAAQQKGSDSARKKKGAPRNATEIPQESQRDTLYHMSRTTFSQYLNTTFLIDPGYTFPIETTLVEVRDTRPPADKQKNMPGKECFVLAFKISGERSLKQGTYQIRHDALGNFEMFVVPMTNKEGELFFEATVNRLIP